MMTTTIENIFEFEFKFKYPISIYVLFLILFSYHASSQAAPVPDGGEHNYKLLVNFKKPLLPEDQTMTVKTLAVMSSKPIVIKDRRITLKPPSFPTPTTGELVIVIIGPGLTDSEKSSVEKFAGNTVDSYLIKHGNGAQSVIIDEIDQPGGRPVRQVIQRVMLRRQRRRVFRYIGNNYLTRRTVR